MARTTTVIKRDEPSVAGDDPSVAGFCSRKGISRATYYNLRKRGCGPREVQPVPGGRIVITPEAERDWEKRFSKPAAAAAPAE
jgi:hypothetical protein